MMAEAVAVATTSPRALRNSPGQKSDVPASPHDTATTAELSRPGRHQELHLPTVAAGFSMRREKSKIFPTESPAGRFRDARFSMRREKSKISPTESPAGRFRLQLISAEASADHSSRGMPSTATGCRQT
jgi:hypothetical protein